MVLNLFGPESLKKMLPEVEQAASRRLQQWSNQNSVELKEATATVIIFAGQKLFYLIEKLVKAIFSSKV